jgi:5'-3' exonuclease, N-terminal resolvase-like domain
MTGLIDADSMVYIIGYNNREHLDEEALKTSVDGFIDSICTMAKVDRYIGCFSADTCFRTELYKYSPYKGNRPPKPDWFNIAAPIIKTHAAEKWGFFIPPPEMDLEADDVVSGLSAIYRKEGEASIILSPDKDLNQIPGWHYDYKKSIFHYSVEEEADLFFWTQMLTGDGSDGVKGIPKIGPVKAKEIFAKKEATDFLGLVVLKEYCAYFGPYYGPIIFKETRFTLKMMSPGHSSWHLYYPLILPLPQLHEKEFSSQGLAFIFE